MNLLNTLLIAVALAGCSRSPMLPDGVSLRVTPSNDIIISLDEGRAVQIRQNKPDHRSALVAHLDGKLQIVQLELGGETPRSMDLISKDKAQYDFTSGSGSSFVLVRDEDGDGIPDTKVENGKKFKRADIEWTEVVDMR